jgi:hypothetical protein
MEGETGGSLMALSLPCKQLLTIGCCLFVVSGLAAQPVVPQPRAPGNAPAPRVGDLPPPTPTPEQLRELFDRTKFELHPTPEEQRKSVAAFQWLRWLAVAAAGAVGIWGARQVLTNKSSPAADQPKPRVDRFGLGADGKGGVWLREVPPWET